MPINWPKFEIKPSNESDANGDYIKKMVNREIAQSAANQKQLQQAKAAEARRIRQESLDAERILTTEYPRG